MRFPDLLNAAALSLLFIHAARGLAPRLRLLDQPGGRKTHLEATPAVGGIGIFAAFALAISLNEQILGTYLVLLLCMAFLVLVGVVDDAVSLGPLKKATLQAVAAAVLIFVGDLQIRSVGDLTGLAWITQPGVRVALTLVVVVGVINAINMADGVDGLAGGIVASALFWLSLGAYLSGLRELWIVAALLLMGVLGFLAFNLRGPWRRRASVFLGDAGSMTLAFAVVWFALELTEDRAATISPFGCALLVALPAIDTLSLFFRRLIAGRNPLSADRQHLHHLLENAGIQPATVAFLLCGMSFGLGGFGIIGSYLGLPDIDFVALAAVLALAHTITVELLPHHPRRAQARLAISLSGQTK